MWLPLALRNLMRNRRRTLLTLAVIAFGAMMSFVVRGMIVNALDALQEAAVAQYGNLQVASPLLWEDDNQGADAMIAPEDRDQIAQLLDAQPQVVAYTPQLLFSGMASTADKAKVLNVIAFEPDNAALDYNDLLVEGQPLNAELRDPVLVGGSLARELDLTPGDFFKLTTNTLGGAYNQETYQVAGIYFRNDVQDESQLVFAPLDTGLKTIHSPGGVSRLAVVLADLERTDEVAAQLQRELDEAGLQFTVRTWEQLSASYRQTRGFFDTLFGFLLVSITMLVFFIVFQVLSMSFFERTREVGTIRAIGTKRHQIFGLFVLESALIGILGAGAGLAAGAVVGAAVNGLGFSWTPPGALQPFPIQAALNLEGALAPLAVSVLATLLSALYPSLHSARLRIVDALRTH